MTSTRKTTNHSEKKLKYSTECGKISHDPGLAEST
jgi:hypothetical protein